MLVRSPPRQNGRGSPDAITGPLACAAWCPKCSTDKAVITTAAAVPAARSDCAPRAPGRKWRNRFHPIAPVATAATPRAQQIMAALLSCRLRHGASLQDRRREGEGDRHCCQSDAERTDVEPAVTARVIEDPAAYGRAERHAQTRDHGCRAEHGAHDAHRKILARDHRIERHHAAIGEAEYD